MRRLPRPLVPLVVSAALLAGCAGDDDPESGSSPAATSPAPSLAPGSGVTGAERALPQSVVVDVVDRVQTSVVTIFLEQGIGSGVVLPYDGPGSLVVTNEHVVRGADEVTVGLADGSRVPGRVRATDVGTDLAIVEVERPDLPPVELREDLPRPGELAIAIGSPLGFEGSVTAGVVSGLSRAIPGSAAQTRALVDLIQTDAPISPGSSGGALFDANGRLIGVNEAYIPPATGAVAIGFAIPTGTVSDVVNELLEDGVVTRAFLGIQPGRITEGIREQLDVTAQSGVLVLGVEPGTPAAEAGLQPGDVITGADGEPVRSVEEFLGLLRRSEPGDQLTLGVERAGERQEVDVVLGETES